MKNRDYQLRVSDEAFRYLVVHRGSLDHLRENRKAWEAAYLAGIRASYDGMAPFLPKDCSSILDVGAGLGGVDVLLSRHYGGKTKVILLDGWDDEPSLRFHRMTTSSAEVARKFHADNGSVNFNYISPSRLVIQPVDLVVSTGAWCFHFPPEEYLDFVLACMTPRAVLITDVRKDRFSDWLKLLESKLKRIGKIFEKRKQARMVFRAA